MCVCSCFAVRLYFALNWNKFCFVVLALDRRVLAMVLISPGQRLLLHLSASIFLKLSSCSAPVTSGQPLLSRHHLTPNPRHNSPGSVPNCRPLSVTFYGVQTFFVFVDPHSHEVSAHSSTATHARPLTSPRRPELKHDITHTDTMTDMCPRKQK